jgi:hypothetical protein
MDFVIRLNSRRAIWVLFALAVAFSVLSITDDLLVLAGDRISRVLEPLLHIDAEASIARWYSISLLLLTSLAGVSVAQQARRAPEPHAGSPVAWASLSVVVLLLSASKMTRFHTTLFWLTRALLRQANLAIPRTATAAALLVILFCAYLPFLISLRRRTTIRLLIAAAVYFAGAVILDLFGGGSYSLANTLSAAAEELVEMTGVILILRALLRHLEERNEP